MWGKIRNIGLVAGIAALASLPAGSVFAAVFTTDPLVGKAKQLADRVHYFHHLDGPLDFAFGPPEEDYCRTMRKASWTLVELRTAASNAASPAAAAKYRRAADDLADELGEEDYLDWKYGEKDWCSPTAWDSFGPYDGPAFHTGSFVQVTGELGISNYRYNEFVDTTLPSSASGGVNSTQGSYGFDIRAGVPITPGWYAVLGGKLIKFYSGSAVREFNLDPISPGDDTRVSVRRDWSGTVYGGVAWKTPTISAMRAGVAGEPGAGTFLTTLWAGYRYDEYCGWLRTNELGIIRRTGFSVNDSGFSVGADIDYPLFMSGFDSLWSSRRKTVVRLGLEYNNATSFGTTHQAQFGGYRLDTQIRNSLLIRIGLGLQFYAGDTPNY